MRTGPGRVLATMIVAAAAFITMTGAASAAEEAVFFGDSTVLRRLQAAVEPALSPWRAACRS